MGDNPHQVSGSPNGTQSLTDVEPDRPNLCLNSCQSKMLVFVTYYNSCIRICLIIVI